MRQFGIGCTKDPACIPLPMALVVAIIAGWQPGNVVVTAVIVILVVVVVVIGVAVVATYNSSSNGRVVMGANRGSGRVAEVLPAPILAAAVFPALAAGRGRLLPPRRLRTGALPPLLLLLPQRTSNNSSDAG